MAGARHSTAKLAGILFAFPKVAHSVFAQSMSNFDADGSSENQWEDRGDLAWNEFDWERYLRGQEESIRRYLSHYEAAKGRPDRIDYVAEKMDWGPASWTEDEDSPSAAESHDASADDDDEVYTLHKNPIYIATKAIYASLFHSWLRPAGDPAKVPQVVAVALLASLHRGEEQAVEAIHALDFGDYAMAVSLFKRALAALNGSLAVINDERALQHRHIAVWREDALPRFFDLREIWLRVIAECRDELDRPLEEDGE